MFKSLWGDNGSRHNRTDGEDMSVTLFVLFDGDDASSLPLL